jgi:hypothetical protein
MLLHNQIKICENMSNIIMSSELGKNQVFGFSGFLQISWVISYDLCELSQKYLN